MLFVMDAHRAHLTNKCQRSSKLCNKNRLVHAFNHSWGRGHTPVLQAIIPGGSHTAPRCWYKSSFKSKMIHKWNAQLQDSCIQRQNWILDGGATWEFFDLTASQIHFIHLCLIFDWNERFTPTSKGYSTGV
jgi:hypothetical protein